MGDINLIPGQQSRGRRRLGPSGSGQIEYSQPEEQVFIPSVVQPVAVVKPTPKVEVAKPVRIPKPPRAPHDSWFKRWQAARSQKKAEQRAALATARLAVPPVAQVKPLAVEVDLLHAVEKNITQPEPPPTPKTPQVYSVRKLSSNTPEPIKPVKREHAPKHVARHEAVGERVELLDVNLIPKELNQNQKPVHPWTQLIWYVAGALILVGGAYGGLRWYDVSLTQKAKTLQSEVQQLDQQIAVYGTERTEASAVQQQLSALQSILSQHVSYDQFFIFLENNTLPTVYYKSLNVDAHTGNVSTSAVTSDFDQIRAQVAVLETNPLVSAVTVTSGTRTIPTAPPSGDAVVGTNSVLFNLRFTVDSSLFHH